MPPCWPLALGVCLAAAQGPTAPLGPSRSYERYLPAQPASDAERQLRRVVRAWGHRHGQTLAYDWRLGDAAQTLLPWAQGHVGEPLPIALLRCAAWHEGWTDGELMAVAISSRAHALSWALALQLEQALAGAEANHMGLALGADGDTVVVALSRRLLHLAPVPQARAANGRLHLVGRVAVPHVTGVTVAAAHPDGAVSRTALPLAHGHFSGSLALGPRTGTMQVELLVERGRGPEVAATFPVAVGHPPLSPSGGAWAAAQAHGQSLTALVWGLRQSHGLALPAPHPALMQVAQAHGQDMRAQHFFAHVSPTSGDVTQRLGRVGLAYAHVVENIAQGSDADDAFAQWLQSPGHLQNLLDPQVTHLGVALVPVQPQGPQEAPGVLAVLVMASLQWPAK